MRLHTDYHFQIPLGAWNEGVRDVRRFKLEQYAALSHRYQALDIANDIHAEPVYQTLAKALRVDI